jgi:serine/threonine-protein kinase
VGLTEGSILAGKYRIGKVLGSGGMGVVVAATHLQLEERVAIKFLFLEALDNHESTARFMREARAAVRIKSEHVARVIDVGTFEGGGPFIVMEYLEGADLARVLATQGPLSVEVAVSYILQAGEALAEAHGLGIVHRDLKPSNLFIARRPDGSSAVKVLDFGISKVLSAKSTSQGAAITRTGSLLGSPLYMSPEQMTTPREVDARSDLWALGAILFEMLTGRPPFWGETVPQLCASILDGRAPPMSASRSDVPPSLEAVVARCLERDRRRRFQSVAELAAALQYLAPSSVRAYADRITRISRASPNTSVLIMDDNANLPAGPTAAESAERKTPSGRHRSRRRLLVAFALAAALVAMGLFLMKLRDRELDVSRAVVLTEPAPRATLAPPPAFEPMPQPSAVAPSVAPAERAQSPAADKIAAATPSAPNLAVARPLPPKPPVAAPRAAAAAPRTLPASIGPDTVGARSAPAAPASVSTAELFRDRK